MSDSISKNKRSWIMSRIKSKDSKIEVLFRKELWKQGFRYRKNSRKHFGKPDLVLSKYKAVIFIDSCFWHGCSKHFRMPAVRQKFWRDKIKRNRWRDKAVNKYYNANGWLIKRVLEHDLTKNFKLTCLKIINEIRKSKPL